MVEARGLRKRRRLCGGRASSRGSECCPTEPCCIPAFPEVTKEAVLHLPLLNQHSLQITDHLQTSGARGRRRAQAEREADRVEKGGGEEHWSAGRTRRARATTARHRRKA